MMFLRYTAFVLVLVSLVMVSCNGAEGTAADTSAAPAAKADNMTKATQSKPAMVENKTASSIEGGMDWLSFDDVDQMGSKSDKKYLVDVYTSWCGWCKVMDKQTFTNEDVKSYVNDKFYPVKFDAERKSPIKFKGKDYEWMPGGRKGINKLAVELLGGRMSYPSLVYLDENMNKIKVSPGFKKPDQLLSELQGLETM